jgi:hypothetical protein
MKLRGLTIYVALILSAFVNSVSGQGYESHFLHLGAHPWDDETDWSESLQGIDHDDAHWYVARTGEILKIPVHYNLLTVTRQDPGVITATFGDTPLVGYSHFGDPDVYRHNGTDYLIMPVESTGGLPGLVVVFRCSDLTYVGHAELTGQGVDAPWCAIDPGGNLYSSLQHATYLNVYDVDWDCLDAPCGFLTHLDEIPLLDEQGQPLPDLVTTQGGEFAPDGTLLYLTSGFLDDNDELQASEGITVMDTVTWRRARHSTNGYGIFNYYYNPGCCVWGEPEGLTIWDLNDGSAPGVHGQLHVIRVNNDPTGTDAITLYHYTNVIYVVPGGGCNLSVCCNQPPPIGCPSIPNSLPCAQGWVTCPFQSLNSAITFAWNGAEIRISPGNYNQTLAITKRLRLTTDGGIVRIGG